MLYTVAYYAVLNRSVDEGATLAIIRLFRELYIIQTVSKYSPLLMRL